MHYLLYLHLLKMMNMKDYEQYGMIPVDYGTILTNLSDYKSPKDKVSKLEKSGDLIRLKKGLYLISPTLSNQTLSIELIANHLYGPSYISLEYALQYHGLIPERVQAVTSVTTGRSRKFLTPAGLFIYRMISKDAFRIGMDRAEIDANRSFLIAVPEKAVADKLQQVRGIGIQTQTALLRYMESDLRIDTSALLKMNPDYLDSIAHGYRSRKIRLLSGLIRRLKGSGGEKEVLHA